MEWGEGTLVGCLSYSKLLAGGLQQAVRGSGAYSPAMQLTTTKDVNHQKLIGYHHNW